MTGSELVPLAHVTAEVGSPMYRILGDHVPALVAVALVPLAFALIRRRARSGSSRARELVNGYRQLLPAHRFALWLLCIAGAAHFGLVLGHDPSFLSLLFLIAGAAQFRHRPPNVVLGGRWRRATAIVLSLSILGYAVAMFAGDPPDQVGLATKLAEIAALAVVLTPRTGKRLRRLAGSAATAALVVVTGISAWSGAFIAAEAHGAAGHHGEVAPPGTLMRESEEREATAEERAAADSFYDRVATALAPYADPAAAARDGYQVQGLAGTDFHAANPAYSEDGRIFDPGRPESLVYAATPAGPVLLGAVYEMPSVGQVGPAIGGPLTEWHGHENVCFSLVPPTLSGLVSPFGHCPVGSIAIPVTPEMIHVWVVPGAPQRFGDLDPEWLSTYLAGFGARLPNSSTAETSSKSV